jgi:hypothetical protein
MQEAHEMARIRISLLLCLALLATAASAAAGTLEERDAPTAVSGIYSVTFDLNILSTLPADSTITCRARIAPNPAGLNLRNQPLAAASVQTVGLAAVTGSTAICAAEIPFSWTVANAANGVVLSYEIDVVSHAGGAPLLLKSLARQSISAALPAPGGNANLHFNVVL